MTKEQSPIKMVARTRDKWRKTAAPKSPQDNAGALGYIIWQIALNGAKSLHVEDFRYDHDLQRFGVIEEYVALLTHLSDRMVFDETTAGNREAFISDTAAAAARHLQRNKEEIVGSNDYRTPLFHLINERSREYAACRFDDNQPGYQMLRIFGAHVQDIMGSDQTNQWVIDQVMEIDASNAHQKLSRSLGNLLSQA